MPRLFIGIKIIASKNIINISNSLKKNLEDSSLVWANPANFHITLKFLGETEAYYINSISLLMKNICTDFNSFKIEYERIGFFGSLKEPRIIWVGFKPNRSLLLLQQSIDKSIHELGFEIENKKFNPHITLCRVKKLKETDTFRKIMNENSIHEEMVSVTQFQLIESILNKEGPEYKELGSFKLKIQQENGAL